MNRLMTLDKLYPIQEHGDDNHVNYGLLLLDEIEKIVSQPVVTVFKEERLGEALRLRTVGYILRRIVTIANSFYLKHYSEENDNFETKLYEKINEMFDLEHNQVDRIFRLVKRVCELYQTEKTKLAKGQARTVKEIAKANLHKCYICGRDLNYDTSVKTGKRDSMEIEHIFPRVFGGGRGAENITVCCENCNKMKDCKLSFSETFFEGFMSSSEEHGKVKKTFSLESRLSMLMLQDSKCFHCDAKFYTIDSSHIYLGRKNENEVYHYLNCYFYCEKCHEARGLGGIEFNIDHFLGAVKYDEKI